MATKTKPTMNYLDDISKILSEEPGATIESDEFTAEMFRAEYIKKHGNVTVSAINGKLTRMVNDGKISKRKITHKATQTNAYKLIK